MNTIVHLLRHGEVFNPDKILYGRIPGYHLSDLGRQQAVLAADFLARRDVTFLACSPLQRAQETAAPLAERLGLPIRTDERLIEAGNVFEGRRIAGAKDLARDPRRWHHFRNPFTPSWGEPYKTIASRVIAAARDAAQAAQGHEAVCVSHQLPIVAARRMLEGRALFHDPRRRRCSLASVTSLHFVGDVVVRIDYSEPAGQTPKGAVAGA